MLINFLLSGKILIYYIKDKYYIKFTIFIKWRMKNSGNIYPALLLGYTGRVNLIITQAIDGENWRATAGTAPRVSGINGIAAAVFSP